MFQKFCFVVYTADASRSTPILSSLIDLKQTPDKISVTQDSVVAGLIRKAYATVETKNTAVKHPVSLLSFK